MITKDMSLEVIVVGPRGSGKTLLLTHYEAEYLADAYWVKQYRKLHRYSKRYSRRKVNVWSNYPVKVPWKLDDGKAIYLSPQPLDIDKLIVWHPDFHDGVIFLDEIDQEADRQDWFSELAKMLTAGVQLMRHRNLSIFASIQSLSWLNARLQWQADVIIKMRDLAYTPWGKGRNLLPGEIMSATYIDKSGLLTGYPYEERPKVYSKLFFGKRYWPCYGTLHEVDIPERKQKIKVIRRVKTIDLTGETQERATEAEAISNAAGFFVYNNRGKNVTADDLFTKAREFGYQGTRMRALKSIKDLGATSKSKKGQTIYNLEGLDQQ